MEQHWQDPNLQKKRDWRLKTLFFGKFWGRVRSTSRLQESQAKTLNKVNALETAK